MMDFDKLDAFIRGLPWKDAVGHQFGDDWHAWRLDGISIVVQADGEFRVDRFLVAEYNGKLHRPFTLQHAQVLQKVLRQSAKALGQRGWWNKLTSEQEDAAISAATQRTSTART